MVISHKTFGPTLKKGISLKKNKDHELNVQQEEKDGIANTYHSMPP